MNRRYDNMGFGILDRMVAGSEAVMDEDTVVTPLDKVKLCLV